MVKTLQKVFFIGRWIDYQLFEKVISAFCNKMEWFNGQSGQSLNAIAKQQSSKLRIKKIKQSYHHIWLLCLLHHLF